MTWEIALDDFNIEISAKMGQKRDMNSAIGNWNGNDSPW